MEVYLNQDYLLVIDNYKKENKNQINFFSDFRQLDYVKIVSYEMESKN